MTLNLPRFPDLDDAIVGITDHRELVYSGDRLLDLLSRREVKTREEAYEYFCAKVRPLCQAPIVMWVRMSSDTCLKREAYDISASTPWSAYVSQIPDLSVPAHQP